jgi:hypothetical protein
MPILLDPDGTAEVMAFVECCLLDKWFHPISCSASRGMSEQPNQTGHTHYSVPGSAKAKVK